MPSTLCPFCNLDANRVALQNDAAVALPDAFPVARAYQQADAKDKFSYFIEEGAGHVVSDLMWKLARDCFQKHLRA